MTNRAKLMRRLAVVVIQSTARNGDQIRVIRRHSGNPCRQIEVPPKADRIAAPQTHSGCTRLPPDLRACQSIRCRTPALKQLPHRQVPRHATRGAISLTPAGYGGPSFASGDPPIPDDPAALARLVGVCAINFGRSHHAAPSYSITSSARRGYCRPRPLFDLVRCTSRRKS